MVFSQRTTVLKTMKRIKKYIDWTFIFGVVLIIFVFCGVGCVQYQSSYPQPLPQFKSATNFSFKENGHTYDMLSTYYDSGKSTTELKITPANHRKISGDIPFKVYDLDGDGNFEWMRFYIDGKEFNYFIAGNTFIKQFPGLSVVSEYTLVKNLNHAYRAKKEVPKKAKGKKILLR
jgi:hypothetical protein